MQSCCLEGCESYKFVSKQKIGYFRFPIFNKPLLKKWLNQIRVPNWKPTPSHLICSTHFHVDDIVFTNKLPRLKTNAIPMIFPLKHFQNLYTDELDTSKLAVKNKQNNLVSVRKRINLINPKLKKPVQRSSVVLLCTPSKATNISPLQINSMPMSNMTMKKIPLKSDKMQTLESSNMNPYLLIVSDKETIKQTKTYSIKKRPILKIQIDKIVRHKKKEIIQINQRSRNYNCMNEVKVDDVSSSKTIVFQLNPSTGKIIVSRKEKLENKNEDSEINLINKNNLDFSFNDLEENKTGIQNHSNETLNNQERGKIQNEEIRDTLETNTIIIDKNQEKTNMQSNPVISLTNDQCINSNSGIGSNSLKKGIINISLNISEQ